MQPRFIFQNEYQKSDTELFKELWQIKMKNYTPKINWRIIRKRLPYNYMADIIITVENIIYV